ncbi:MAG: M28 family metallopeptidase [Spirochaetota bacterium]
MATGAISEAAKSALHRTNELIKRYGPRLAGSPASAQVAMELAGEYDSHCHHTTMDEFEVRPFAFLGFLKVAPLFNIAAALVLFLFPEHYLIAALGFTLASTWAFSQFICYGELFDPLYKGKKGFNVSGIIEPIEPPRQQVIISGHHDSAYEFRYMSDSPKLYRLIVLFIVLSFGVSPFIIWLFTIYAAITGPAGIIGDIVRWALLSNIVFAIPMLFFTKKEGTPGAGDNLIASSITVEIARMFGKKAPKENRPRYTRIILASFDAEESGIRGARAYARMHRDELTSMPTWLFNMDSLYYTHRIKFLTRDLNGFIRLSSQMADDCTRIAHSLGYNAEPFSLYPGAGATDAAELAKIGVHATTLIALATEPEKEDSVYHTQNDTVDSIEPGVVEAAISIAASFIREKDGS